MAFYYQFIPNACSSTNIQISDIDDIDIVINSGIAHTFNIEATDDEGTLQGDQDFCGEKTYTLMTTS